MGGLFWAATGSCQEGDQEHLRDIVGEVGPVGCKGAYGVEQVMVCIGFEEVSARSGAQAGEHQCLAKLGGEDENFRSRQPPAQAAGNFQSVDQRERVFDYGDVGFGEDGLEDCLFAVGGFCDHLKVGSRMQDPLQSPANDLMSISDKDTGHGVHNK